MIRRTLTRRLKIPFNVRDISIPYVYNRNLNPNFKFINERDTEKRSLNATSSLKSAVDRRELEGGSCADDCVVEEEEATFSC